MNITEQLRLMGQWSDQSPLRSTPPLMQQVMLQAHKQALPVGTLFVVTQPLVSCVRGSYDRASKDLWCYFDDRDPQGERKALQCLFVLLAHAHLQLPIPQTIERDWEQELVAWKAASALARQWRWQEVFSEREVEERREEVDILKQRHVAAGLLAGTRRPSLARAAYQALVTLQHACHWNEELFETALEDGSEDESVNAAMVDFHRTLLRSSWRVTAPRRAEGEGLFGVCTFPQTPRAAQVLRRALEMAADLGTQRSPLRFIERTWVDDQPLHVQFLSVEWERDLGVVIDTVNSWLCEEGAHMLVDGRWEVYGDQRAERIYRLSVHYEPSHFSAQRKEGGPAARELWVLFHTQRMQAVEAAWQRYIVGWSTMMDILSGVSFKDALRELWHVL